VPPTALAAVGETERLLWFRLDPTGTRAVFGVGGAQGYSVQSVPVDGSGPAVLVDGPQAWPIYQVDLSFTPDGLRVVRGSGVHAWWEDIRSASIDGSALAVSLAGPMIAGGKIGSFQLSPDGGRVLFVADRETDEVHELYSVPADGSAAPVKLSGAMVAGGDVGVYPYLPSAWFGAGGTVVYLADQRRDGVFELFRVPLDGSQAPVPLSGSWPDFADVRAAQLTPDGTRVVFVADALEDETFELFRVPVDGSSGPARLHAALVAGGDVGGSEGKAFTLTPDGEIVLYLADQRVDERSELFAVPVDGGEGSVRVNTGLVAGGDVGSFRASPDSSQVLYIADQDSDGVLDLYASLLRRPERGAGGARPR